MSLYHFLINNRVVFYRDRLNADSFSIKHRNRYVHGNEKQTYYLEDVLGRQRKKTEDVGGLNLIQHTSITKTP